MYDAMTVDFSLSWYQVYLWLCILDIEQILHHFITNRHNSRNGDDQRLQQSYHKYTIKHFPYSHTSLLSCLTDALVVSLKISLGGTFTE